MIDYNRYTHHHDRKPSILPVAIVFIVLALLLVFVRGAHSEPLTHNTPAPTSTPYIVKDKDHPVYGRELWGEIADELRAAQSSNEHLAAVSATETAVARKEIDESEPVESEDALVDPTMPMDDESDYVIQLPPHDYLSGKTSTTKRDGATSKSSYEVGSGITIKIQPQVVVIPTPTPIPASELGDLKTQNEACLDDEGTDICPPESIPWATSDRKYHWKN